MGYSLFPSLKVPLRQEGGTVKAPVPLSLLTLTFPLLCCLVGPLSSMQGYEKALAQVLKLRLESTCVTQDVGDGDMASACLSDRTLEVCEKANNAL